MVALPVNVGAQWEAVRVPPPLYTPVVGVGREVTEGVKVEEGEGSEDSVGWELGGAEEEYVEEGVGWED
jgi:hypothetical protein